MTELSEKAREVAAQKRARGSIFLKNGRILTEKERAKMKEKAQNTPYLYKILDSKVVS